MNPEDDSQEIRTNQEPDSEPDPATSPDVSQESTSLTEPPPVVPPIQTRAAYPGAQQPAQYPQGIRPSSLVKLIAGASVLMVIALLLSYPLSTESPSYSEEDVQARVERLYLTGDDPFTSYRFQENWPEMESESPTFFRVEPIGPSSMEYRVSVTVERGDTLNREVVVIDYNGMIRQAYHYSKLSPNSVSATGGPFIPVHRSSNPTSDTQEEQDD